MTVNRNGFGDRFKLTLITNDPVLASRADQASVDRIGVDLEHLGKAERQAGFETRLSRATWDDLARVAQSLSRSDLFVRLNPLNPGTAEEVETALGLGSKVVMLPFFRTPEEVAEFTRLIRGRAYTTILVETASAVVRIRDILSVSGIDEVMIGLNDLRLQFEVGNHFEALASPLVDMLAAEVLRTGRPLGIGGVARVDDTALPIAPDLIYAQYPRLGATSAWIARKFLVGPERGTDFAADIRALRDRLTDWGQQPAEELERARNELAQKVRGLRL